MIIEYLIYLPIIANIKMINICDVMSSDSEVLRNTEMRCVMLDGDYSLTNHLRTRALYTFYKKQLYASCLLNRMIVKVDKAWWICLESLILLGYRML